MWVYYTNYRPIGGSEMISYDMPSPNNASTACSAKVLLRNDKVVAAYSDCD